MRESKTEKKTDIQTYNRTKSVPDSVGYRHKTETDFVGSGYYPPGSFVPLLAKFSHPVNASQQARLFNQLQRHYGNRYVQRVVAAYRSQNAEGEESRLVSEILSKKGSGGALEPGNQVVQRLFKSNAIQAKLRIGQPNDIYEQEADRVAEQVIRMPEPKLQWQPERREKEKEEEELIQAKRTPWADPEVTPNLESRINSIRGGGQPLPTSTRAFFEPRFGYDFSHVRVHTDTKAAEAAREVNARAFTIGRDVVFGLGQYAPGISAGQRLMAHELTHVVQQQNQKKYCGVNQSERYDSLCLRRKLAVYSTKEAQAFKWFLTPDDANNFQYPLGPPHNVTMKISTPTKVDDPFRFNILKMIIGNSSETLLIRGFSLDEKVTPHRLFKNGKKLSKTVNPTLREMSRDFLGAGGVTIPSESLALAGNSSYNGPVTGVTNKSWIFYSTPTSLAHEFGHAFLLFSGTAWMHGGIVPETAGVTTPEGTTFTGAVDIFISKFTEEKYAELVLTDPEALHFSPTVIRKWPELPDYKLTFEGTWLQFLKKYPGSTAKQEFVLKNGKRIRRFKICIPQVGQFCPW